MLQKNSTLMIVIWTFVFMMAPLSLTAAESGLDDNLDSIENEDSKIDLDSAEEEVPNKKSAKKKDKKASPKRATSSDKLEVEDAIKKAESDQVDYDVIEE